MELCESDFGLTELNPKLLRAMNYSWGIIGGISVEIIDTTLNGVNVYENTLGLSLKTRRVKELFKLERGVYLFYRIAPDVINRSQEAKITGQLDNKGQIYGKSFIPESEIKDGIKFDNFYITTVVYEAKEVKDLITPAISFFIFNEDVEVFHTTIDGTDIEISPIKSPRDSVILETKNGRYFFTTDDLIDVGIYEDKYSLDLNSRLLQTLEGQVSKLQKELGDVKKKYELTKESYDNLINIEKTNNYWEEFLIRSKTDSDKMRDVLVHSHLEKSKIELSVLEIEKKIEALDAREKHEIFKRIKDVL